jgi:hypothetical protein
MNATEKERIISKMRDRLSPLKIIRVRSLFRALGFVLTAFLATTRPASAITEGYVDGSIHPNVAAVDIRLAGLPIVASGVLISPTVLVTAGHVTRFFDLAGQTHARVTFDPIVSESSTWYWGAVHTNPAYKVPETQDDPNDLGVIVFDEPIPNIAPAQLPSQNFLDQFRGMGSRLATFDTVGYGTSTHVGGANNQGLFSFTGDGTRRFGRTQFVAAYTGWLENAPFDGHPCYGDSGGPVLFGSMVLAIHKANANGNFCTGVTFDMRMDTPAHRAFLGQYVLLP